MCFPRVRAFSVATPRPCPRKSLSMLITLRGQKHSHLGERAVGQVQYSISGVSSKMRRCGKRFHMSLPWQRRVLGHEGHFMVDLNPAQFHRPPQNPNHLAVSR